MPTGSDLRCGGGWVPLLLYGFLGLTGDSHVLLSGATRSVERQKRFIASAPSRRACACRQRDKPVAEPSAATSRRGQPGDLGWGQRRHQELRRRQHRQTAEAGNRSPQSAPLALARRRCTPERNERQATHRQAERNLVDYLRLTTAAPQEPECRRQERCEQQHERRRSRREPVNGNFHATQVGDRCGPAPTGAASCGSAKSPCRRPVPQPA